MRKKEVPGDVMNICIVENEEMHAKHLDALLLKWSEETHVLLKTDCFTSAEAFLAQKNIDYQLIFLDIQLEQEDGLSLAQTLRKNGFANELVFLTAYRDYVFEGYQVHALNYLLKPITYDKLNACMQFVYEKYRPSFFFHRYRDEFAKIPYNEILYFSGSNQYVEIITAHKCYRETNSLKNVATNLPPHFLPCHRSLIVNIFQIEQIAGKDIVLPTKERLPVSDTYLKSVRHAFLHQTELFNI